MSLFQKILNEYFSPEIKSQGLDYFEDDRVTNVRLEENTIIASVEGTEVYEVRVVFNRNMLPTNLFCTCPYTGKLNCKHIAATLYKTNSFGFFTAKYYRDQIEKVFPSKVSQSNNIEVYQSKATDESVIEINTAPDEEELRRQRVNAYHLEIERIKEEERFNGLKAMLSLLSEKNEKVQQASPIRISYAIEQHGLQTTFKVLKERLRKDGTPDGNPKPIYKLNNEHISNLPLEEQLIIHLILTNSEYLINPFSNDMKNFRKYDGESHILNKVLESLTDKIVFDGKWDYRSTDRLNVHTDYASPTLNIDKIEDEIFIWLEFDFKDYKQIDVCSTSPILDKPLWIQYKKDIFRLKHISFPQYFIFFNQKEKIKIPSRYEEYFEQNILNKIASVFPIRSNTYNMTQLKVDPIKQIFFEEIDGELTGSLKFRYNSFQFGYDQSQAISSVIVNNSIIQIIRDVNFETESVSQIRSLNIAFYDDGTFKPKVEPIQFLFESIPLLKDLGFEIFGVDKLKNYSINFDSPKLKFNLSSGIDWFDVSTDLTFGQHIVPFEELITSIKNNSRYIRLDDGSTGLIPERWLKKLQNRLNFVDIKKSSLRISKLNFNFFEELEDENVEFNPDANFISYQKRLIEFKEIKSHVIPKSFKGTLRPYQKSGYDWLMFLKEFQFGGILADDMGLGKTVQVLALLSNLSQKNVNTPSIVIAPTSVVFNWLNEIERFTPYLKVLNHTGTERVKESIEHFAEFDLVITSYPILVRDIDNFKQIEFQYVILDESQKIKNPTSLTAKSAFELKAKNRLCLTGTPIENNLLEIWSQMNFLNPGYLGSLKKFNDNIRIKIEKDKDEETSDYLKKLLFPFVLRRTKTIVASELPEKSEIIHYCEMTEEQKSVYDIWRESIKTEVLSEIHDKGLQKSSFKIIEGLLRLRQICNHPILINNSYKKNSGKVDEFKDLIQRVTEEGHKVLVFSQFVQMLEILKHELTKEKISFEYLTGKTKNRQECVENFQNNPEIKVFLISLKAGGVGLNLTAADYVFHIDPWWNPAVEMQATDRSHRIGQDKKVFVYKFITKESIEEKILNLQEQKKTLIENIISTESGVFKNLTTEDISFLLS